MLTGHQNVDCAGIGQAPKLCRTQAKMDLESEVGSCMACCRQKMHAPPWTHATGATASCALRPCSSILDYEHSPVCDLVQHRLKRPATARRVAGGCSPRPFVDLEQFERVAVLAHTQAPCSAASERRRAWQVVHQLQQSLLLQAKGQALPWSSSATMPAPVSLS